MSVTMRSPILTRALGQDVDHAIAHVDHLPHLDLDVGRLTLRAAVRLMHEHARVGQGEPLAGRAGREEHGRRRCGLADTDRRHVRTDELHGVVDGEQRSHVTAGGVDVEADVAFGVGGLEVDQLGDHQVRDDVVDGRAEEHDALTQQAAEDVVGALAPVRRLDHRGYQHLRASVCATDWLQVRVTLADPIRN